jgi:tetratricopeptide (TPR) repeat protein
MIVNLSAPGRKIASVLLFALLCGGSAIAANIKDRTADKARYDHCLGTAALNPAAALGLAGEWTRQNGGVPAQHCMAVALVGLKRYPEAAARLDVLGRAPGVDDLRSALFDQAGNAWLLAGEWAKAASSFQSALALSGGDPDLYADLARAQAAEMDWKDVEADLNAALSLAPKRADLLVLRASARHALGNLVTARADADWALMLKPNMTEALVERGSIARDRGDMRSARADFQAVLKQGQAGEAADTARRNLAALDAADKKAAANTAPVRKN